VLGALAVTASASADPPTAKASLSYERQSGAEACPDEAALREQVALRLGYDPFEPEAPHRVGVSITKGPRGLAARITTRDSRDGAPASRDLESEGDRCDELVQSIVLAVSLAIDPLSFAHPRVASPPPEVEPERSPAPEAESPPPPAPPPPSPWTLDLGVAGRVGFGLVPGVSVGPFIELRVGQKRWALLAVAGADLPTTGVTAAGSSGAGVEASLIRGGLGACTLLGWFSVCGRFDLGALQGSGTGEPIRTTDTTLYADFALTAGLSVPLANGIRLLAGGELAAPVTRTTLYVSAKDPVWTTPTLAGSFTLGVGYRF